MQRREALRSEPNVAITPVAPVSRARARALFSRSAPSLPGSLTSARIAALRCVRSEENSFSNCLRSIFSARAESPHGQGARE
eukprot:366009-Chlamydomonas_euryale.AAC.9